MTKCRALVPVLMLSAVCRADGVPPGDSPDVGRDAPAKAVGSEGSAFADKGNNAHDRKDYAEALGWYRKAAALARDWIDRLRARSGCSRH